MSDQNNFVSGEIVNEIIINDLNNHEALLKEIREKIKSRSSKIYNLSFIFAKKKLNSTLVKNFSKYFAGIINMRALIIRIFIESFKNSNSANLDFSWMLLNEEEFKEISNGLYDLLNIDKLNLNLERNQLFQAEELFVALSTLKNLKNVKFNMSNTKLSDQEFEWFCRSLMFLINIEEFGLNMDSCFLTENGFKFFNKALKNLKVIKLFHLSLTHMAFNSNSIIEEISNTLILMKNLTELHLDFSSSKLSSESLITISNALQSIKLITKFEFNWSRNVCNDAAITEFSKLFDICWNIKELTLSFFHSKEITDAGLKVFSSNIAELHDIEICQINFKGNKLTQDGINIFFKSIKKFRNIAILNVIFKNEFNLSGASTLFNSLEFFKKLAGLEINLKKSGLDDDSSKIIANYFNSIKTLEKLTINLEKNFIRKEITSIIFAISSNRNLKNLYINLSFNPIQKSAFRFWYKAFRELNQLEDIQINLEGIILEEDGADGIAKAILSLKQLKYLDLNLKDTMISLEGVRHLAKALRNRPDLKFLILNLQHCNLDKYGTIYLEKMLKSFSQLKELKIVLTDNKIDDEGFVSFSKGLKALNSLKSFTLIMADNSLTNNGIEHLALNLEHLYNLKHLEINLERKDNTMDEFMEEKPQFDILENESPGPSKKVPYENINGISPSKLNASSDVSPLKLHFPGERKNRDSFSPMGKIMIPDSSNLRKDSAFAPLFIPNLNPNMARLSFLPPGKSASYDINEKSESSPKRSRGTTFKKKENWRKSPPKNNKLDNRLAFYLSKVLKKLRGLVRLKINLEGNNIGNEGIIELGKSIAGLSNLSVLFFNLQRNGINKKGMSNFLLSLEKLQDLSCLEIIIDENNLNTKKDNEIQKTLESINFFDLITKQIQKFPRLNFYKDEKFLVDEEEGVFHLKIVDFAESRYASIMRNGVEEIYSTYKNVFNELNIDFNKSEFMDLRSMSTFFDNISFNSRLFKNITFNLNDLTYSVDFENFEGILLENLAKIYSSSNFTFHSNFLVPFHSDFWKGIFLLKSQRNWKLYIFNTLMPSSQEFDQNIFHSLLSECDFKSIDINKPEYNKLLESLSKICVENRLNQELFNDLSTEWAFDQDVGDFIDEYKYHFTRYREFLLKLCFNPTIVALISPEIFENIVTSHNDETVFAEFVNIIFQKSLLIDVPSLLPSHILKHKRYGKYLTVETLGLLFYYLTDRKNGNESDNLKQNSYILMKIHEIHQWKVRTFNELNLENNLNLCSLSCKSNIHKFLMKYWQSFKLKAPIEFYNNKYFSLKDGSRLKAIEEHEFYAYDDTILFSFYEKTQMAFKSFELDSLDDYYGELIIKVIKNMPFLRKVDVSGLNLGDNFCQMYSDFLIKRKIHSTNLKMNLTNLMINLSNNKRITNVGLKYLYVSFELAYCKQPINSAIKLRSFFKSDTNPMNSMSASLYPGNVNENSRTSSGPTIDIDSDARASSSTTYILDNGLGSFILLKIRNYFAVKKKYCFNCDKEVCSQCHKDWSTHEGVENINCKKMKLKEAKVDMESNKILECLLKEQQTKEKEAKNWKNYIKFTLYYLLLFPCLFDTLMRACIPTTKFMIIYLKKIEASFTKWFTKLGQKTEINNPNLPKKYKQILYSFVMGYDEDPKQKEVTKFKFNYNVNVLNGILAKKRILYFYYINLLIYYIISIITPIWFPIYCNVFYGVYAFITFVIETVFILAIIKIINDKSQDRSKKQKNLIHNFSLKYYLPLLFFSQIEKYDFFTDIQFVIHLFRKNDDLSTQLAIASLTVLTVITIFKIIPLLFFTYDSFISQKEKIGIANENINNFSMLSFLTDLKGVGFCLDLFSTKNALKTNRIYVPQIMFSSISKCLLENIPLFIIQMINLIHSEISDLILYTIVSTIISFIGAIKTALLAKGSVLTKKQIKEKFSADTFSIEKNKEPTSDCQTNNIDEMEIPLENIAIKIPEKYLAQFYETSPFSSIKCETGRELINSNKKNCF